MSPLNPLLSRPFIYTLSLSIYVSLCNFKNSQYSCTHSLPGPSGSSMDSADRRIEEAEQDADRERMHASTRSTPGGPDEESNIPLSRSATSETASSSSSSASRISIVREEMTLSRYSTMPDAMALSRHPTTLSRIQTARSQREITVGAGLRSRTVTRESKKTSPWIR